MAADLGAEPPTGSKNPRDYVKSKILLFFDLKYGYEFKAKIAAGNFGKVFSAVHHGANPKAERSGLGITGRDTPVAIKMMELDNLPPIFKSKFLAREIEALKTVRHENALRIYDIMNTGDPPNRTFIFMEFAPNGNIQDYIVERSKAPLKEDLAGYWMNQIFAALEALHDTYHIAHRDLKLENVMLGSKMEAKVADFGFARTIVLDRNGKVVKTNTFCGTAVYEAPQILKKLPYDPVKADVWATGVMLYGMVTMKQCFHCTTLDQLISEQRDGTHKLRVEYKTLPQDCRQLIDVMLRLDEEQRPTIAKCRTTSWARRLTARPLYL